MKRPISAIMPARSIATLGSAKFPRGLRPCGQTAAGGTRRRWATRAPGSRLVDIYQRAPRFFAARIPSRTASRITQ